jgi:hypothetical protein
MFDRPPLKIHAIAMATDLKANHARTERLEQHLGVGWVVAKICDNDSIGLMAAIDHCERTGTRTSIKPLREHVGLQNSN